MLAAGFHLDPAEVVRLSNANAVWRENPLAAVVFNQDVSKARRCAFAAAAMSGASITVILGCDSAVASFTADVTRDGAHPLDDGKSPPPALGLDDVRFLTRCASCDEACLDAAEFFILIVDPNLAVLKSSERVRRALSTCPVALVCPWWPSSGGDNLRATLAEVLGSKAVASHIFAAQPAFEAAVRRVYHKPSYNSAQLRLIESSVANSTGYRRLLVARASAAMVALPEHVFSNETRVLCVVEDTYVQTLFQRVAMRGTNASRVVFVGKAAILSDLFVASKHVDATVSWAVVFPVQFLIRHEESMVLERLYRSNLTISSVAAHTWSPDADEALVPGWARSPDEASVIRAIEMLN